MTIKLIISDITSSAGTQRAVVNLANNLSKHDYNVTILSLNSFSGESYFPVNPSVIVRHLKIKSSKFLIKRVLFGFFKILMALYQEAKRNPDTFVGTNHVHNFALAILKVFLPANRHIGCEHMSYTALTPYSRFLSKKLYGLLDCIVVLTEEDKVKFNKDNPSVRCEAIPNELSFYPADSSTCDNQQLLAIGRYTYQKGFDLLLNIVVEVFKKVPNWTLNIVGEGEMKKELEDKIRFFGFTDRIFLVPPTKDVSDLYLRSSIYLMTSHYEGLPMVLLEAKACGLPIIAYNCPTGPSVIIEQNDGILIDLYDSTSFIESLLYLINNAEERKLLGKNARLNSLQYSSKNIFTKWNNLLNQI